MYAAMNAPVKAADHQGAMLEAFSNRLLQQPCSDTWRKVFLKGRPAPVRFEEMALFLVCTDAPRHGLSPGELEFFATQFGGWCEPPTRDTAVICFDGPGSALRAALLLQRIGADSKLRAALTAATCSVAVFEVDGADRRSLLPQHDALALEALSRASAGMLVIAAEAFALLEPLLAQETGHALVTTEFHADAVAQVSITLLPAVTAAMSTFAGLGRC